MIDASVGTPVDPMPSVVLEALAAAAPSATGYPATIGSPSLRDAAAGWIERRFGCVVAPDDVLACIGTKELVASLPRALSLRAPSRDTVLFPAVAYPTYEMGALLAGLRPVPVPVDAEWHLDLDAVDPADAARGLVLWLNDPATPPGRPPTPQGMVDAVEWARARGIVVASDECYAEFTYDADGCPAPPVTALRAWGRRACSRCTRCRSGSNMAGLRSGFVAGDHTSCSTWARCAKHGGLMMPTPVQAATAAALGDDEHVREQQGPLRAPARARAAPRSSRAVSCTTADRRPSTCGCATQPRMGRAPATVGPSPTTSPRPVSSSRPATSTAQRAPITALAGLAAHCSPMTPDPAPFSNGNPLA